MTLLELKSIKLMNMDLKCQAHLNDNEKSLKEEYY